MKKYNEGKRVECAKHLRILSLCLYASVSNQGQVLRLLLCSGAYDGTAGLELFLPSVGNIQTHQESVHRKQMRRRSRLG